MGTGSPLRATFPSRKQWSPGTCTPFSIRCRRTVDQGNISSSGQGTISPARSLLTRPRYDNLRVGVSLEWSCPTSDEVIRLMARKTSADAVRSRRARASFFSAAANVASKVRTWLTPSNVVHPTHPIDDSDGDMEPYYHRRFPRVRRACPTDPRDTLASRPMGPAQKDGVLGKRSAHGHCCD